MQTQIDKQKQIQDQAYSYNIIGSIFSAFECYANKFQKNKEKQTNIFSAYNNFNCGTNKSEEHLKYQIIAQLEIFNVSYQLYQFQYSKYDFPSNLGKEEMKKLLDQWASVVPQEDKKYYKAAYNIINGNPHVSYTEELGNDSAINPQFLANATEMIYQANQVGKDALDKYKETGEAPSMELYSKKKGNAKINKTSKREDERKKDMEKLDKLFDKILKELKDLLGKPVLKQIPGKLLPFEEPIYEFSQEYYQYTEKWKIYWYKDSKEIHNQKKKEINNICNTLIQKGYDKFTFNTFLSNFSNDQK